MKITLTNLFILILLMTSCTSKNTIPPKDSTMIPTTKIPSPTPTAEAVKSSSQAKSFAITDVSVVDVENGVLIPNQTVVVVDDSIDQMGEQGKVTIPQGAQIIDGHGLYLMPGLVDAHVHFLDAPVFGRLMIANGVLLVRDTGMPNEYILPLRDELNRGETLGPEMIATGWVLDGYPPLIPPVAVGIKTPEEGREAVRKQVEAGVDMIKVYSKLDKDVFLAILDEAKKLGIKVVGHVPDTIYIEDAARAGLSSSEHFFGFEKVIAKLLGEPVNLTYAGMGSEAANFLKLDQVDPQDLQAVFTQLRDDGLTVCPTVVTFKVFTANQTFMTGKFPMSEYISASVQDTWKSLWGQQAELPDFIWQNWAKMVNGLNQAGVPLMVGTDLLTPGIIPGFSVHQEMVIWQEAGISPADVLRSATWVPTQFMGLEERLGSINVGKTASMILVRANPLEDVQNASQIEAVFLGGQYFDRSDLDQMLAEARELAKQPSP
jgi:imidazolonepropionase-like amidohydrolase